MGISAITTPGHHGVAKRIPPFRPNPLEVMKQGEQPTRPGRHQTALTTSARTMKSWRIGFGAGQGGGFGQLSSRVPPPWIPPLSGGRQVLGKRLVAEGCAPRFLLRV